MSAPMLSDEYQEVAEAICNMGTMLPSMETYPPDFLLATGSVAQIRARQCQRLQCRLERKKFLVICGPPGSRLSHLAAELCHNQACMSINAVTDPTLSALAMLPLESKTIVVFQEITAGKVLTYKNLFTCTSVATNLWASPYHDPGLLRCLYGCDVIVVSAQWYLMLSQLSDAESSWLNHNSFVARVERDCH